MSSFEMIDYVSAPLTGIGQAMFRNIKGVPTPYPGRSPWAIVDLDDVIADFSTPFLDYLMTKHGHVLQLHTGHYGLHAALGKDLGQEKAKEILADFYDGDYLREIPLYEGAKNFLYQLRHAGFHIHALTGRPGWKHRATVKGTVAWAINNGLPFDSVNFCIQKGKFLRFAMKAPIDGSRIVIGFEDNADHALDMAAHCTAVYLRQKHYNFGTNDRKIVPFTDFDGAFESVLDHVLAKSNPDVLYPQTSLDLSRRT